MKKLFVFILFILFIPVNLFSQDFKQVTDGIEYAEMMRGTAEQPIRLNLLKLDLTKVRLDVVHALDAAIGLEKTSSIAKRHGAMAAINAGFLLMQGVYQCDAAGVLKIDGKVLSESFGNRIALGIFNGKDKTEIGFGHLSLNWEGGYAVDSQIIFSGVNRERKADEVILYTPEFHRTTLTDSTGTEIILTNCSRRCEKAEILENKGSSVIPTSGYVISIGKNAKEKAKNILFDDQGRPIKNIARLLLYPYAELDGMKNSDFVHKAEDIIAGVPQLIKNGKIAITWEQEKIGKDFVETKHPRTAVAKLKDGKFLMVTVDGRQPEHSIGINLNDLAALLLELGATDAMNLDGGGSTTMFLNGEIKNKPSDKTGERSVSDVILVFPRKKQ